jgi:hypothetical protein
MCQHSNAASAHDAGRSADSFHSTRPHRTQSHTYAQPYTLTRIHAAVRRFTSVSQVAAAHNSPRSLTHSLPHSPTPSP